MNPWAERVESPNQRQLVTFKSLTSPSVSVRASLCLGPHFKLIFQNAWGKSKTKHVPEDCDRIMLGTTFLFYTQN